MSNPPTPDEFEELLVEMLNAFKLWRDTDYRNEPAFNRVYQAVKAAYLEAVTQ